MKIENLSQFKKAIAAKTPFVFVEHYIHPECIGQIRVPNIIQTNAFYSVVKDEPNHPISVANRGMGYRMDFDTAKDWTFKDGLCTAFDRYKRNDNPERGIAFTIRFLEEA